MSGFSGYILKSDKYFEQIQNIKLPNHKISQFEKKYEKRFSDCAFNWHSNAKFHFDKGIYETDEIIYGFEGIQLKWNESFHFTQNKIFQQFISKFTNTSLNEHVKSIKGSFQIFVFNKSTKDLFISSDHTNSKPYFYFENKDIFLFSSSIFILVEILKSINISYSINYAAAYQLLGNGFISDNSTLVAEIKKLEAGSILHFCKNENRSYISTYYTYSNNTKYNNITNSLIAEIDQLFENNIRLEYQKDIQYNFDSINTLSGGLDSRMVVLTGRKKGFTNFTNITFSENFSNDELVARKITNDFKDQHILFSLNNGVHLQDINTPLYLNNCSVYFFGAAQTYYACSKINFSNFGLLHHGGLAETSKGGYLRTDAIKPVDPGAWGFSRKFESKYIAELKSYSQNHFENDEMYAFYTRGFQAIHNGNWMIEPFTSTVYPFMETQFAELALSISPKLRYNAFFTIEWLKQKNPEMAFYNWNYGIPPTNNSIKLLKARIINKLKRTIHKQNIQTFPINKWLHANANLNKNIFNSIEWIHTIKKLDNTFKKDIIQFKSENSTSLLLTASLVKSLELLFSDATK